MILKLFIVTSEVTSVLSHFEVEETRERISAVFSNSKNIQVDK